MGSQTSDISDGPVMWLHVPNNNLFVHVLEIRSFYQEFSSLYMQSALTIALVMLCAIKVPSQEQVVELCVPLCCMLPVAEPGGGLGLGCEAAPSGCTMLGQVCLGSGFHPQNGHSGTKLQPSFDKGPCGSQCASKMVIILFLRHFSVL